MANDIVWLSKIPRELLPGGMAIITVDWSSIGTPSAAGSTYIYRDGEETDYSSTAMSGSVSLSGNVQTSKTITAVAADVGRSYIFVAEATIGGVKRFRKLQINIVQLSQALFGQ